MQRPFTHALLVSFRQTNGYATQYLACAAGAEQKRGDFLANAPQESRKQRARALQGEWHKPCSFAQGASA
jgi:hypothetical protein